MLAQGPVNSDVRKQIRLVRYQSEKISASYQVQGFGENGSEITYLLFFSCGFVCFTSVEVPVPVVAFELCEYAFSCFGFVIGTMFPVKRWKRVYGMI